MELAVVKFAGAQAIVLYLSCMKAVLHRTAASAVVGIVKGTVHVTGMERILILDVDARRTGVWLSLCALEVADLCV